MTRTTTPTTTSTTGGPDAAPGIGTTLRTWALLGAGVAAANLVVLGVATLAGAAMVAEQAGSPMDVTAAAVVAASFLPLLVGVLVWTLVARRSARLARVWRPGVVVLFVLSLGSLLGAEDVTTGVALGVMHAVVAGVAAFVVPARLPR